MDQKIDQTMDGNVSGGTVNDDEKMVKVSRLERTAETFLRLASMSLCVAALVVMAKNSVSNDVGSVSYSSLGSFKYLVNANGVCAGYSLLSAMVAAMPRPASKQRAWTLFFSDQVFTYVVLAAGVTSAEMVYLTYNGNYAAAWSSACDSYGRFCHKAWVSVLITFLVVVLYTLLSIISSYRLFSKYKGPASTLATMNHHTGTDVTDLRI